MKKTFFSLVFATAVIGAFAFKAATAPVTAFYSNAGSLSDCSLSDLTNESDCTTAHTGIQCTVNASGNPKAWNQSDCSQALRRP